MEACLDQTAVQILWPTLSLSAEIKIIDNFTMNKVKGQSWNL
jgi:hypothetical protein